MFQCDPIRLTVACSSYGDITSGVVEAIAAILQLREPWRRGGEKRKGRGENQCPIYRSKFWTRHCRSISGVVQPFDSAHRLQILYGSRVNSDTQLISRAASVEPQMAWRAVNARHPPLDI